MRTTKIVKSGGRLFPCRGIVFDKDGTLIDIFSMLAALGRERYKNIKARVPESALRWMGKCTGFDEESGRIEPFGPLASATRDHEAVVSATALWLQGIPWYQAIRMSTEAFAETDRTFDPSTGVRLLPGAKETIEALYSAGISLCIATSDQHKRAESQLNDLGMLDYFEVLVGADDVVNIKPAADPVLRCAEVLGVSPKDLVMVGDAPQDAMMGRNAGAMTIGLLSGVGTRELLQDHCDVVIEGVKDISVG